MSWRESQATALEEQAGELDAAIAAIAVAHDVLESRRRDQPCTELRQATSMLRGEANAIRSEASALRVSPDRDAGMPMALTTRHVRRRRPDTREEDDRDLDDLRGAVAAAAEPAG